MLHSFPWSGFFFVPGDFSANVLMRHQVLDDLMITSIFEFLMSRAKSNV